jgi:hypothetical protein
MTKAYRGAHHETSPPKTISAPGSGRRRSAASRIASAQSYPTRAVKIIVPVAAGRALAGP